MADGEADEIVNEGETIFQATGMAGETGSHEGFGQACDAFWSNGTLNSR